MIERNLTVTVNNNTSTLNEKLVFYARDRGILIHFLIKDVKYMFSNSSILGSMEPPLRAEIYALKPNGRDAIRFDSVTVSNSTVDFILTETLTDDLDELGIYKLQIVIYSDNDGGRLAIPPFEFEVKDLLTRTEGTRQVAQTDDNVATIDNFDYGVATASEEITSSGFNPDTMEFDMVANQNLLFPSGGVLYAHKLNNVYNVINDACDAMPDYIMRETYDELGGKSIPQAISEVEVDIDLSGYALKEDIPSTDGLASEDYVNQQIEAIEIPEVDLEGLATEDYVNQQIDAIEIPEVDLKDYALKSELPSVDGLASTTYVDDAINTALGTIATQLDEINGEEI